MSLKFRRAVQNLISKSSAKRKITLYTITRPLLGPKCPHKNILKVAEIKGKLGRKIESNGKTTHFEIHCDKQKHYFISNQGRIPHKDIHPFLDKEEDTITKAYSLDNIVGFSAQGLKLRKLLDFTKDINYLRKGN